MMMSQPQQSLGELGQGIGTGTGMLQLQHGMGIAARSQAGGEEMVCSNGLRGSVKVESFKHLSPVSDV